MFDLPGTSSQQFHFVLIGADFVHSIARLRLGLLGGTGGVVLAGVGQSRVRGVGR